ncbi:MAG: hypothetical protein AB7Q00_14365 [Phycisphaerales bacterium]
MSSSTKPTKPDAAHSRARDPADVVIDALMFYADERNYVQNIVINNTIDSRVADDNGERARKAISAMVRKS